MTSETVKALRDWARVRATEERISELPVVTPLDRIGELLLGEFCAGLNVMQGHSSAQLLAMADALEALEDRVRYLSVSTPGELLDQGRNEGAVHAAQRLLAIARGEPHRGQFGDATLEAAAQAIGELRRTLSYYANPDSYDADGVLWRGLAEDDATWARDQGETARDALGGLSVPSSAPPADDTPERSDPTLARILAHGFTATPEQQAGAVARQVAASLTLADVPTTPGEVEAVLSSGRADGEGC